MAGAAHIHVLVVPEHYSARDAWFETWIWGAPLVPPDTPCSRIVWWCLAESCPEGAWPQPDDGSGTAERPFDQDAST